MLNIGLKFYCLHHHKDRLPMARLTISNGNIQQSYFTSRANMQCHVKGYFPSLRGEGWGGEGLPLLPLSHMRLICTLQHSPFHHFPSEVCPTHLLVLLDLGRFFHSLLIPQPTEKENFGLLFISLSGSEKMDSRWQL